MADIVRTFAPRSAQADTSSQAQSYVGTVLAAPADGDEELRVRVPAISQVHEHVCKWQPRSGYEGGVVLPQVGDQALVHFATDQDPWVSVYWTDNNTGDPDAGGPGDKHYEHDQNTPSATWTVTHNLGTYPSVTVVDSGGSVIEGEIDYTNANTLTIDFFSATSGKAYLN